MSKPNVRGRRQEAERHKLVSRLFGDEARFIGGRSRVFVYGGLQHRMQLGDETCSLYVKMGERPYELLVSGKPDDISRSEVMSALNAYIYRVEESQRDVFISNYVPPALEAICGKPICLPAYLRSLHEGEELSPEDPIGEYGEGGEGERTNIHPLRKRRVAATLASLAASLLFAVVGNMPTAPGQMADRTEAGRDPVAMSTLIGLEDMPTSKMIKKFPRPYPQPSNYITRF